MTVINSINGTCDVLDSLHKAWKELHSAYLTLCEINEGTYKNWQAPLAFTEVSSPELHRALEDLRQKMAKMCYAATGAQPGPNSAAARSAMCKKCHGCNNKKAR